MTHPTHEADPTLDGMGRRVLRGFGWTVLVIVTALEVLAMGDAGLGKFRSLEGWMYWFARFGYPPRLSLVVVALEFIGAGLLLIPRLASYAAMMLAVIMSGALEAVLTPRRTWAGSTPHCALAGES